uniref:Peptidase_M1_N domain-containing protein n=1 Tax=Parastrongyloides trichosuri TaxID=131310 RepID=A0A0N4Z469_PARTI
MRKLIKINVKEPQKLEKIRIRICTFIECSICLFITWLVLSLLLCVGFSLLIYFSFLDLTNWIPIPKEIPNNNIPLLYDIEIQFDASIYEPLTTFSGTGVILFKCTNECTNYFYINIGKNLMVEDYNIHKLSNNNDSVEIIGSRYQSSNEIKTFVINEKFDPNFNYTFSFNFYGNINNTIYGKLFSYTGVFTPKSYGILFGIPEDVNHGLRYLIPSFDNVNFVSPFRWSIIRRSEMKSFTNSIISSSQVYDGLYFKDVFKETIPLKTVDNTIIIYNCDYNDESNIGSNVNISSCFRTSALEKLISIDRIIQFMCEESYDIGKMDAIIIPGVQTIYKPGIGILNEGETISEAKTLSNLGFKED